MPIKLICDLCKVETELNYNLISIDWNRKGKSLAEIRAIQNNYSNKDGIICLTCLIQELEKIKNK